MREPSYATKTEVPRLPGLSALRIRDERLVSLQALAGQLAHDFNNFLAPILGYVSLIKEEVTPDTPVRQYAESIERAARKTEASLETIMLAARPQRRHRPQKLDFTQLVDQVLTEWTQSLPPTCLITVSRQLEPCTLILDEAQWRVVLQQLLHNSHYALATGGALSVTVKTETLPPARTADLGLPANTVCHLVIQDNGFGMPPDVLARACEPLFTTRPKNQAKGLGLAIVYGIVRLHGGQLLLESEPDSGTTVHIWVPILNELPLDPGFEARLACLQESPPSSPEKTTLGLGKKVLVVDDDPMVLEVLRSCLQKAQFEVHVARDGREGLEVFQKRAQELCLVISDVTMPHMSGIEMLQRMRETHPSVQVILISGDADATREEKLSVFGAYRPPLLKKPFTIKELLEALCAQLKA